MLAPPTGPQEYEELAVALGTDHARREGLRTRLKAGRLSSPLFDTDTWVRAPPQLLAPLGRWRASSRPLDTMCCTWCRPFRTRHWWRSSGGAPLTRCTGVSW
jgi:hypothetical protein